MHLQTPELTPFFVLYWRFLCTEQKGTGTDHCSKKFDVLPRVSLHPVSSLFHLWVKSFNPETQVYPPPGFFFGGNNTYYCVGVTYFKSLCLFPASFLLAVYWSMYSHVLTWVCALDGEGWEWGWEDKGVKTLKKKVGFALKTRRMLWVKSSLPKQIFDHFSSSKRPCFLLV